MLLCRSANIIYIYLAGQKRGRKRRSEGKSYIKKALAFLVIKRKHDITLADFISGQIIIWSHISREEIALSTSQAF